MKQLHDHDVSKPCKPHSLTPEQKQNALGYLIFLKQKQMELLRDVDVLMNRKSTYGQPKKIQHL